jgi:hypothetical protein
MGREEYNGITSQSLAALKRLRDARKLLSAEPSSRWLKAKGLHARGAMYLAGYAIERKLKAAGMEIFGCHTLSELAVKLRVDEREVYTHGLEAIARRLPFWNRLRHGRVYADFSLVNTWRPSWRYDPHDWPNSRASVFLSAVTRVYDWLDQNH